MRVEQEVHKTKEHKNKLGHVLLSLGFKLLWFPVNRFLGS
jgi:hypothetical protein